ncbi:MAG: tRNA 2-thiouridine(34) synthase MnmA, partial [Chryseobacterium sp.]|nr:tRNA 2-thiouridine(34) synthase MnmA [Chryseobacterium sp.]
FLQQQLKPKEGEIVEIFNDFEQYHEEKPEFSSKLEELEFISAKTNYKKSDGKVIGKHQGAHYFTIGQSKGLGIGGHKESCFMISRNMKENLIFVGEGRNFPGLFREALKIENADIHWVREDLKLKNGETLEVSARIRYRQPLEKAALFQFEEGLFIEFESPQSAIAEGQFAAWYDGEELLGSGVIS